MSNYTGAIVRSVAGHDAGNLFYVLETQGEMLVLANGKRRKLVNPKRKKLRHVEVLSQNPIGDDTGRKICQKQSISDRELRQALAAFRGGNYAWQKKI